MIVCSQYETRFLRITGEKSFSNEEGEFTRARFKVARGLDLETMAALEEGEGLKALLEVSKNRVDSSGPNTIKVTIKRELPPLLYTFAKRGKAVGSVVGKVVNSATVAIVEGNPSLVFSFEADVPAKLWAKLGSMVKRDDTALAIADAPEKEEAKSAPKAA